MSIPHWDQYPIEWDALRVGIKGDLAPGIVKTLDVSREYDVDFKKGGDGDGETMSVNGAKLARVRVVLELWTVKHLERLESFLAAAMPKKYPKDPKPMDYVHPKLAYHGLKSLFLHKLSDPSLPGEDGKMRITLDLANFRPPKPKPKGGISSTLGPGTMSRQGPSSSTALPATPGEIDTVKEALAKKFAGIPGASEAFEKAAKDMTPPPSTTPIGPPPPPKP